MEADAEASQANNLDPKRKHEQRMNQSANMADFVKEKQIIISGQNADELLGFFKETGDLVKSLQ